MQRRYWLGYLSVFLFGCLALSFAVYGAVNPDQLGLALTAAFVCLIIGQLSLLGFGSAYLRTLNKTIWRLSQERTGWEERQSNRFVEMDYFDQTITHFDHRLAETEYRVFDTYSPEQAGYHDYSEQMQAAVANQIPAYASYPEAPLGFGSPSSFADTAYAYEPPLADTAYAYAPPAETPYAYTPFPTPSPSLGSSLGPSPGLSLSPTPSVSRPMGDEGAAAAKHSAPAFPPFSFSDLALPQSTATESAPLSQTHLQDAAPAIQPPTTPEPPHWSDPAFATTSTSAASVPYPSAKASMALQFYLEPLIETATAQTIFYRTKFTMLDNAAQEIDPHNLLMNADQSGLRPSLDYHAITQALPLLQRLQQRHAEMRLFLPLGVATLQSMDMIQQFTQLFQQTPALARGLVLELQQSQMSELGEEGILGLAHLARAGVTMAYMNASLAGLDLGALAKLNVRYIGMGANSVEAGYGVSPALRSFASKARDLQIEIIVTDIIADRQAISAPQIARFVCGPYYAPPRRVKSPTLTHDSYYSQAA